MSEKDKVLFSQDGQPSYFASSSTRLAEREAKVSFVPEGKKPEGSKAAGAEWP